MCNLIKFISINNIIIESLDHPFKTLPAHFESTQDNDDCCNREFKVTKANRHIQ